MVESTALEMRRTGNRTVGSNPTLSAIGSGIARIQMSRDETSLNFPYKCRHKCAWRESDGEPAGGD